VLNIQTTTSGNRTWVFELLESSNCCVHDVDRVRRTERLAQNVMDTGALKHGADRSTGDNTGTCGCGTQKYNTGCSLTLYGVRDGHSDAGNAEEVLLRFFDTLGDSGRNFASLAVANADHSVTVSDDDESREAKATTTLDDLGNAVDGDNALEELALLSVAAVATVAAAGATFAATTTRLARLVRYVGRRSVDDSFGSNGFNRYCLGYLCRHVLLLVSCV
jgi:hypothetical protein